MFFMLENLECGPIITCQNINKQLFPPWSPLHGIRYDGLYVVTREEMKRNKLEGCLCFVPNG